MKRRIAFLYAMFGLVFSLAPLVSSQASEVTIRLAPKSSNLHVVDPSSWDKYFDHDILTAKEEDGSEISFRCGVGVNGSRVQLMILGMPIYTIMDRPACVHFIHDITVANHLSDQPTVVHMSVVSGKMFTMDIK